MKDRTGIVSRWLAPVAGLAAVFASAGVSAQTPATPPETWTKVCSTNPATSQEVCAVRGEARADDGRLVSSVTLQPVEGGYGMVILVPLGARIPPGIVVSIDTQRVTTAEFSLCAPSPPACIAEVLVEASIIDRMKRGNAMSLVVTGPQSVVTVPVTLIGFTRVFDGPGITPEEAQRRAEAFNAAAAAARGQAPSIPATPPAP